MEDEPEPEFIGDVAKVVDTKLFYRQCRGHDGVIYTIGQPVLLHNDPPQPAFIGVLEKMWKEHGVRKMRIRWFYRAEDLPAFVLGRFKRENSKVQICDNEIFLSDFRDQNDLRSLLGRCNVLTGHLPRTSGSEAADVFICRLKYVPRADGSSGRLEVLEAREQMEAGIVHSPVALENRNGQSAAARAKRVPGAEGDLKLSKRRIAPHVASGLAPSRTAGSSGDAQGGKAASKPRKVAGGQERPFFSTGKPAEESKSSIMAEPEIRKRAPKNDAAPAKPLPLNGQMAPFLDAESLPSSGERPNDESRRQQSRSNGAGMRFDSALSSASAGGSYRAASDELGPAARSGSGKRPRVTAQSPNDASASSSSNAVPDGTTPARQPDDGAQEGRDTRDLPPRAHAQVSPTNYPPDAKKRRVAMLQAEQAARETSRSAASDGSKQTDKAEAVSPPYGQPRPPSAPLLVPRTSTSLSMGNDRALPMSVPLDVTTRSFSPLPVLDGHPGAHLERASRPEGPPMLRMSSASAVLTGPEPHFANVDGRLVMPADERLRYQDARSAATIDAAARTQWMEQLPPNREVAMGQSRQLHRPLDLDLMPGHLSQLAEQRGYLPPPPLQPSLAWEPLSGQYYEVRGRSGSPVYVSAGVYESRDGRRLAGEPRLDERGRPLEQQRVVRAYYEPPALHPAGLAAGDAGLQCATVRDPYDRNNYSTGRATSGAELRREPERSYAGASDRRADDSGGYRHARERADELREPSYRSSTAAASRESSKSRPGGRSTERASSRTEESYSRQPRGERPASSRTSRSRERYRSERAGRDGRGGREERGAHSQRHASAAHSSSSRMESDTRGRDRDRDYHRSRGSGDAGDHSRSRVGERRSRDSRSRSPRFVPLRDLVKQEFRTGKSERGSPRRSSGGSGGRRVRTPSSEPQTVDVPLAHYSEEQGEQFVQDAAAIIARRYRRQHTELTSEGLLSNSVIRQELLLQLQRMSSVQAALKYIENNPARFVDYYVQNKRKLAAAAASGHAPRQGNGTGSGDGAGRAADMPRRAGDAVVGPKVEVTTSARGQLEGQRLDRMNEKVSLAPAAAVPMHEKVSLAPAAAVPALLLGSGAGERSSAADDALSISVPPPLSPRRATSGAEGEPQQPQEAEGNGAVTPELLPLAGAAEGFHSPAEAPAHAEEAQHPAKQATQGSQETPPPLPPLPLEDSAQMEVEGTPDERAGVQAQAVEYFSSLWRAASEVPGAEATLEAVVERLAQSGPAPDAVKGLVAAVRGQGPLLEAIRIALPPRFHVALNLVAGGDREDEGAAMVALPADTDV